MRLAKSSNPSKVDGIFRRLQLISSAAYSLGHGGNDAQKVMGIIAAAMVSEGLIGDTKNIPEWVPLACYSTIALGTMVRWLAYCQNHGTKNHQAFSFRRF